MKTPRLDDITEDAINEACAISLGWKRHETWCGHEWEDPAGNRGTVEATAEREDYWVFPPRFTQSADAALTLCAWMKDQGWVWRANNSDTHSVICFQFVNDEFAFDETADTLPLAICRAFLKANHLAE